MKKIATLTLILLAGVLGSYSNATIITGSNYGGANLTPANGDTLSGTFTNVGTFHIISGRTVYIAQGVILSISANTILIEGTLNGNGMGHLGGAIVTSGVDGNTGAGSGPGIGGYYGPCVHGTGGGGGAYGGDGGNSSKAGGGLTNPSNPAAGGISYGNASTLSSIFMGSGGGSGAGYCPSPFGSYAYSGDGGNGGGAVELIASGDVTITGTITVNGQDGVDGSWGGAGGGGAGGGVNITAATGLITGSITANGGNGGNANSIGFGQSGGGGGGGRIKLSADICTSGSTLSANGGTGGTGAQFSPTPDSAPGNVGTISGGTNSCGKALHFDGTDDYVSLGNPSQLQFTKTNAFTLETWIKSPSGTTADQQLISKIDNNFVGYGLQLTNGTGRQGRIEFYLIGNYSGNNALWIRSNYTTDLRDNTWHHIAATYDGSNSLNNIHIYIDGVDYGHTSLSTTSISADITNSANLHIGSYHASGSPNEYFTGLMDDARIWSTSRTCSEIKAYMNHELVGNETNLAAYYRFNQGVPNSNNAGVTTLNDLTSNALNGTLTNFALSGSTSNWAAPGSGISGTTPDAQPEINVTGNAVSIVDGDVTPAAADHTDFGTVVTLSRTFTIENNNAGTLNISSITLSGANAGDFTITGAPSSVSGNSTATFSVNFFPTVFSTARNAVVTINNSDCDEAAYDFAITGIGVQPSPGGVSTNLNMWNKANAQVYNNGGSNTLAVNGQTVDKWDDQSSSANHLLQSNNPNKPVYRTNAMNFNPVLTYSGNQFLDRAAAMGITGTSSHTYFVVFNTTSFTAGGANDGSGSYIIDRTTGTNELAGLKFISSGSPLGAQKRYDNGSGIGAVQSAASIGLPVIAEYHRQYNVNFGLSVNNATPSTIADNSNSLTPPIMRLGRHQNTTNGGLTGDIAEVIVYSTYPTAAELARINSYLAIKYGITLNQSTAQAYYNSAGSIIYNSQSGGSHDAYDSDIAGIGRDATSGLDQRYSRSINTNSKIQMEKPAGFAADNTFLMWGSNGQAASPVTTNAHPSYTYRLARVWRADITGTPGSVAVKIVLGGSIPNTGNLSDYALLRDNSDADFSTGATAITPSSFNGDTLIFNSITFSSGDYFTLATQQDAPGPGHVTTNLNVWIKGNAATYTDNGTTPATNGQSIQQWNDASSGRVFRQTNNANKPTLSNSINFNPAILFTGNNFLDLTTSLGIGGSDDYTYLAVFMPTTINNGSATAGDGSYIIDRQTGTNNVASLKFTGSNNITHQYRYNNGTGLGTNQGASLSNNNAYIAEFHRDYNVEFGIAVNGGTKVTSGSNTNDLTPPDLRIGRHASTVNAGLVGELAEVIVYGMYPTAAELNRINSYLAIKYGITLDQTIGQNYVSSSGTIIYNSAAGGTKDTFDKDITGIGRDDLSALDQRQSKSVNIGSMLTIGNGTIAVNNASNTNTFATDQSFFVAGHNGRPADSKGTTDYGISFNPLTSTNESIEGRLTRVWSATETGSVGTLKLRFDMSAVYGVSGLNTNALQFTRLLVDADGIFASGAISVPPSSYDNTTGIVEFDWNFAGGTGFFFTVATNNSAVAPLPVTWMNTNAKWSNNDAKVSWKTAQEEDTYIFRIERSINGNPFTTIGEVGTKAQPGNNQMLDYTFIDENIKEKVDGTVYYRIRWEENTGKFEYSPVMSLNTTLQEQIQIFPNPASNILVVNGKTEPASTYSIVLRNTLGEETFRGSFMSNEQGLIMKYLEVDQLPRGIYTIEVRSQNAYIVDKIILSH